MSKVINLIGQRFGRLIVKKRVANDKYNNAVWECQCDCGEITYIPTGRLRLKKGNTSSCGCYMRERRIAPKKHGDAHEKLYKLWQSVKNRCFIINNASYKFYGAKGITMCQEWSNLDNGYNNFKKWAYENGYKIDLDEKGRNKLSLDRIDNSLGYFPSNCRWATSREQAYNRSTNIKNKHKLLIDELLDYADAVQMDYKIIIDNLVQTIKARKEAEVKYWGNEK